jgi:hypothetical protein
MKPMRELLALAPLLGLALLAATPAGAGGPPLIYLDLDVPVVTGPAIPGNCSTWHELWPAHCALHHQDAYEDADGDMMISPCDVIKLDGADYHIVWVGPTYFLRCTDNGAPSVYEPTDPTGGNPTCEFWHEVYPVFSQQHHVENWEDNGDGLVSVCDYVWINGCRWHIERIGLNIIIEPGPTSSDADSWGRVKEMYR